ncbi:hypothetical protein AAFF_G00422090 [Aldrovandia affinis]|uniref:Uncharacterized protein n=1 Tax=Aldrovandia affinis TaxID=143900 RepID=A0AAD7R368_9TELE|nr:hypothetical protein AAFF_G00422090 [Aldrovandia affinis]
MVPFLAKELQSTLTGLLSCFIKREELAKIKTPLQLTKLDPQEKQIHVPLKHLDIGFSTKQALQKASEKLQENPVKIVEFKKRMCLLTRNDLQENDGEKSSHVSSCAAYEVP